MSKKQLLTESEMRRFMRLANIPALGKNLVSEMSNKVTDPRREEEQSTQEESLNPTVAVAEAEGDMPAALPAGDAGGMDMGGQEGGETVEVGGDADPEMKSAFEAAVQALADAMGIDVEVEGQEENAEEGGEEMHDLDMGGEEEGGEEEDEGGEEDEMQEAKKEEEDEEELDEKKEEDEGKKKLSEDELVEAVLSRVTARLVAEAKKKKMSVKAKMKKKAEDKKEDKKEMKEATEAKGGGPLLSKGGNKHDTYKGHADMEMTKGEKGGKGGHEMETVSAKADHTVTHGKTNLATKGGNKTK